MPDLGCLGSVFPNFPPQINLTSYMKDRKNKKTEKHAARRGKSWAC